MKQSVIYLRVSTVGQAEKDHDPEGYSIPAQRDACHRKATTLDAEVIGEYVDRGESARSADRPQLLNMLAFLKANPGVEYVIVHKVDRLARNREDDVYINLALRAAGSKLVSATENIDETPSGKLLHGIMATIAEFYSRNLAAEVIKGSTQKAKSGGTPGRVPVGYFNTREMVDGHEIRSVGIDPDRAPLIQFAFETYAQGQVSLIQLVDMLAARGLTTRATLKQPARALPLPTVAKLLKNPYYVGFVRYRGVSYPGRHQALVSPELFDQVQLMLRLRASGEKQRTHMHYLKSSVYCGRCEARLCLSLAKGTYLYFFCVGRAKGNNCDLPYLATEDVEDMILESYKRISLTQDESDRVENRVRSKIEANRVNAGIEAKRQTARLQKLTLERNKLLQAYYAEAIALDMLAAEQNRINREVIQAETVLKVTKQQFSDIEKGLTDALSVMRKCYEVYRHAGDKLRRQMNQLFFERIYVDTNSNVRSSQIAEPFQSLVNLAEEPEITVKKSLITQKPAQGRKSLNKAVFLDGSSKEVLLVATGRFELPTKGL